MARVIKVVPAVEGHIPPIAENMRKPDADEVWALNMKTPYDALIESLENSYVAWTGTVDRNPVVMFGVGRRNDVSGVGLPWLLGTPEIEQNMFAFLKRCRPFLDEMLKVCPILMNKVDANNTLTIKWLEWLGFKFGDPYPCGPFGVPFRHFYMRASHV